MNRECGFYWVRVDENPGHLSVEPDQWEVAHWDGLEWAVVGSEEPRDSDDLLEIDERRLVRPSVEGEEDGKA